MHDTVDTTLPMASWVMTDLTALWGVALSTVLAYVAVIGFTRLGGLRSFSKLSGFDFAITVAIGSVLATTVVSDSPALLQGGFALGMLYLLQSGLAWLRKRVSAVEQLIDNKPLLLMSGPEICHDNLRQANVTEADLRAKLREANVYRLEQVLAVVLETTGDVSVLHSADPGARVERVLLQDVRGAERLTC